MKKVGLFGGTFDPIHLGHLNLAVEIFEQKELNEILFSPTSVSPLRKANPPIGPEHRANMVELAIDDHPHFSLYTGELEKRGPAFTVDTISHLTTHYPKLQFFLILGEDTLIEFDKWREPENLLAKISPLIGSRSKLNILDKINGLSLSSEAKESLRQGVIETACFDISSTEIRRRMQKKLYCHHLLPRKVLDYIYENQLYF